MQLRALQTLIAAGESLTLELKKSTAEKGSACRSLCAMTQRQGRRMLQATRVMLRTSYQRRLTESMHATDRWEMQAAFIHRDYASAAGSVSVALYDDRLEVISPGELHFGLTPELLYLPHESKPWNPWIAKVFYRRGLIETWGRGTLKIAALMQAAGLAAPTLRVNNDFVTMTFALPESLVRLKRGGEVEEALGKSSEKSSEKILRHLRQKPTLSAKVLAEMLGLSPRAIEKQINLLKNDGKLVRNGPAKGGHWQVIE